MIVANIMKLEKIQLVYSIFKNGKVMFTKRTEVGFTFCELTEFFMYETCYNKLQHYFGEANLLDHYMDTDSFVLTNETD